MKGRAGKVQQGPYHPYYHMHPVANTIMYAYSMGRMATPVVMNHGQGRGLGHRLGKRAPAPPKGEVSLSDIDLQGSANSVIESETD